jgi:hypothetical protein
LTDCSTDVCKLAKANQQNGYFYIPFYRYIRKIPKFHKNIICGTFSLYLKVLSAFMALDIDVICDHYPTLRIPADH